MCEIPEHLGHAIPLSELSFENGVNYLKVVKCSRCGFYFCHPVPKWGNDVERLYDDNYFTSDNTEWLDRMKRRGWPKNVMDEVEKIKNIAGLMLDVGCGEGYLLREAGLRGWECEGIEATSAIASKIKNGINIKVGLIEEIELPEQKYDVITMISVLEHISEPMKALHNIKKSLKKDGILYLVVPNEDCLKNKVTRASHALRRDPHSPILSPFENPFHVAGFSRRTILYLSRRIGFRLLCLKIAGGRNQLKRYQIRGAYRKIRRVFSCAIQLSGDFIGMGNTITAILARER